MKNEDALLGYKSYFPNFSVCDVKMVKKYCKRIRFLISIILKYLLVKTLEKYQCEYHCVKIFCDFTKNISQNYGNN